MKRLPIRDRDRKTTEAFQHIADAAAHLAALRTGEATADARAVAVLADVLGALAGLADAFDRHRANGRPAELVKTSGAALVGTRVVPGK